MENNQKVGPIDASQVAQMVTVGRIRVDTLVWREGLPEWFPAGGVADLPGRSALATQSPPLPPMTAANPYRTPTDAYPAFSGAAMAGLIIATIIIPLIGLIMGPMAMTKPQRKGQGIALLVVALVMFVIYIGGNS